MKNPVEGLKASSFQTTFNIIACGIETVKPVPQRNLLPAILGVYVLILLGACFWPFNFFQKNRVEWQAGGGLRFSGPGIAYTNSHASAIAGLTQFTLLMHFVPESPGQPSWILSYGLDFDDTNLLVGAYTRQVVVEIHKGGKRFRANLQGVLEQKKPIWLAVSMSDRGTGIYLNGELKKFTKTMFPENSSWEPDYPLVVGARSDGKYPWSGVMYQIAILDSAHAMADLRDPSGLLRNVNPLVNYDFRQATGTAVMNTGVSNVGPLVLPENFVPFRNSVLMDLKDLWNPLPIWGDIVLNILVFVPIGVLVAAAAGPNMRLSRVTLLAVALSFLISLSVELLQSLLPRRWSTFMDVATNTFGGFLGVTVWLSGLIETSWRRLSRLPIFGSPDGRLEE